MTSTNTENFTWYGWTGLILVIVFWILNWSLTGIRTHWGFFPMWLGYCLSIDAWVFARKGSSLLKRNWFFYILLFVFSAPSWWLFEVINWRTQNWLYMGRKYFTDLQYVMFASLSFSTVMPAVFETAELFGTFKFIKQIRRGPKITPTKSVLSFMLASGFFMFILIIMCPWYFFPLVWVSLYFLIEPLNVIFKNRSFFDYTRKGDWRPVIALCCGCLMCGFLWEMWNFYSYPKWIYNVPFVGIWHVFEMPLLGYGRYLPFSLELSALYHLLAGLTRNKKLQDYIIF